MTGSQERTGGPGAAGVRLYPLLAGAAFVALGIYLLWFRIEGVASDFWMMLDQIGDWDLVQGSFRDLPVTGTGKSGGGTHPGPAYYWFLWLTRLTFSPWTGRLPHAAGISVSAIDALGFAALGFAIFRVAGALPLALAAALLTGTVPYEAALARAAWNPNFALGLANLALASSLAMRRWTAMRIAIVAACAWMAVQAHLAALPVALAVFAVVAVASHRSGGRPRWLAPAIVLAVVFLLQAPRLFGSGPRATGDVAGSAVTASLASDLTHPGSLLSLRGVRFVLEGSSALLARSTPIAPEWAAALLALAVAAVVVGLARRRVGGVAAALALLPLALAAGCYALLAGELHPYLLQPLLGALALVLALAPIACRFERLPGWARGLGAWAVLALVVAVQPARLQARLWDHRYPPYAAVVRGAGEIARAGPPVKRVEGPFDAKFPTSSTPVVRWLGGQISPDSPWVARIAPDGGVSYAREP